MKIISIKYQLVLFLLAISLNIFSMYSDEILAGDDWHISESIAQKMDAWLKENSPVFGPAPTDFNGAVEKIVLMCKRVSQAMGFTKELTRNSHGARWLENALTIVCWKNIRLRELCEQATKNLRTITSTNEKEFRKSLQRLPKGVLARFKQRVVAQANEFIQEDFSLKASVLAALATPQKLFLGLEDGSLIVCDLDSFQNPQNNGKVLPQKTSTLAYFNQLLASGSKLGQLQLLDLKAKKRVWGTTIRDADDAIGGEPVQINSLAFFNPTTLAVGLERASFFLLFSLENGKHLSSCEAHEAPILYLSALQPNHFISYDGSKQVIKWNTQNKEVEREISNFGWTKTENLHKILTVFKIKHRNTTIDLWDYQTQKPAQLFDGTLVCKLKDNTLYVQDIMDGEIIREVEQGQDTTWWATAYASNGELCFLTIDDKNTVIKTTLPSFEAIIARYKSAEHHNEEFATAFRNGHCMS